MNYRYLSALCALFSVASTFGCRVTFINDTEYTVFAFDDGNNEGNIVEPSDKVFYGEKGRHPDVILYIQAAPDNPSFKKSYRVLQIACALNEADKILPISKIVKDEINKDIYTISNFANGVDTLTCCEHHGSSMNHENHAMAIDEPLSTMDEE